VFNIDQETIEKAAQRDLAAFEELYRQSSGFIYSTVLGMVDHSVDAEEITQEIFIKIYKFLPRFRFASSFKTWVYRIAVNTVMNYFRKVKRNKEVPLTDALDQKHHTDFVNPLMKEETDRKVRALFSLLDPQQRRCIVLRSIQGLSYREIASVLKMNMNTVRTQIKRAREKMIKYGKEVVKDEM
jgi:RNA polymerase sigma-70 factor, ECF subfamily